MNIDFIKWMCDKAEGFVIDTTMDQGDWIVCPDGKDFLLKRLPPKSNDSLGRWMDIYYPLLLQRRLRETLKYVKIDLKELLDILSCDSKIESFLIKQWRADCGNMESNRRV